MEEKREMSNQRLKAGVRRIRERKAFILFPVLYVALMIAVMFMLRILLQKMGEPYSGKIFEIALYVFIAEMIFAGLLGIIQMLGKPFGAQRIEGELLDVGFTDSEGESPMLISRTRDKNGYILEFYSQRIPFVRYEDHIAEIETALNIKIVDVLPGRDKQHTIIKAVNGNGGKKNMIMWSDEKLSADDFVLVLGESYFGIESIDISTTPHVLIGGGSGSGKSKLLKLLLMEARKKNAVIYLSDFKGGVDYPAIWHKACHIITEPEELDKQLARILQIMEERKLLLVDAGTPNISEYNKKTGSV